MLSEKKFLNETKKHNLVDRGLEPRWCNVSMLTSSVVDRGLESRWCNVSMFTSSVVDRGLEPRWCEKFCKAEQDCYSQANTSLQSV